MTNDWQQLFSNLGEIKPPENLLEKISNRLRKEQKRLALSRLITFSLMALLSLGAFIPALQTAQTRLIESGFIQFFSLLFSDFKVIITLWQSFILSLLETLPILSLATTLTALLIFLESLKLLMRETKKFNFNF